MRKRIALVTGGSRGIGAACVKQLDAMGYQVAFCYNNNAAAAQQVCRETQNRALAVQADVSDSESVNQLFDFVRRHLGEPEILVCSAGIAQQKLFCDITDSEWKHMLDTNLSGAFYCCRQALPAMIRTRWGRIILVSSMWGQTGGSCEVHYSAAKAGLIGLGKALAKEEGPSGVTVNIVAPGVIETDMMACFTPEDKQALAEETPVGRLGTAEETAKLIAFLVGEDTGYITGQVIGQNGGLVI